MLRQVVPVRGSIVGHCYYDATERDLSVGAEDKAEGFRAGDVAKYIMLSNQSSAVLYVRILMPHYAQIVEAYLDLWCMVAGSNGVRAVFAPVDGLTPVELSGSQIDDMWRRLYGKSDSIKTENGKIQVAGLNMKPVIPERTRDSELMALVLAFDVPPQSFKLERLNLLLGTEVLV